MALQSAPACLIASDFYRTNPISHVAPTRLYDLNSQTGASSHQRATTAPPLIGLAWGPGGALYGVSTFDIPPGYQPNSLYRIDPATGATQLVGPIGMTGVGEGDMATNPATGEVYAIIGDGRLVRFPGLNQFPQSAGAVLVGVVNYPTPNSLWDISGLTFDSVGQLFAVSQAQGVNPPPAHLLRLNPANGAVLSHITMSQRVHVVAGFEFMDNSFYLADGHEPGQFNGSDPNNSYNLYRVVSNGGFIPRGPTGIVGGVSLLVSCKPPKRLGCLPPPPDMDAWYPMDGNGNDRILGRNAASTYGVTFVAGKVDQAARLFNAYMIVPDDPVLDQGRGDFSIDAWVNIAVPSSGIFPIIDKRDQFTGWVLYTFDGRPSLQLNDGNVSNFTDSRTLTAGWHHVAVTVDRNNPQGLRIYIDGVADPTPQNPTPRNRTLDSGGSLSFGLNNVSQGTNPALMLDEVEFFDRALDASEVAAIFNAGSAGKCK